MLTQSSDFNWQAFSLKRGTAAALVVILMLGLGVLLGGLGIVITYSALLTLMGTLAGNIPLVRQLRVPLQSAVRYCP